jgi:hypothetical protein
MRYILEESIQLRAKTSTVVVVRVSHGKLKKIPTTNGHLSSWEERSTALTMAGTVDINCLSPSLIWKISF